MDRILLTIPELEHAPLAEEYLREHERAGEHKLQGSGGLVDWREDYLGWAARCAAFRNGDMSSAPELVPATTFFGLRAQDGKLVGMIDVRHSLNDYLAQFGGHIGYGVAPGERKKGYASQMLRQALDYCREVLGLEKALVTCNQTNEASRRTILKAGGALENEITEDDGTVVQRYWVPTSRRAV